MDIPYTSIKQDPETLDTPYIFTTKEDSETPYLSIEQDLERSDNPITSTLEKGPETLGTSYTSTMKQEPGVLSTPYTPPFKQESETPHTAIRTERTAIKQERPTIKSEWQTHSPGSQLPNASFDSSPRGPPRAADRIAIDREAALQTTFGTMDVDPAQQPLSPAELTDEFYHLVNYSRACIDLFQAESTDMQARANFQTEEIRLQAEEIKMLRAQLAASKMKNARDHKAWARKKREDVYSAMPGRLYMKRREQR